MAHQFRWEGIDVGSAPGSFRFAVGRIAALGRMRMMSKFRFVRAWRLPIANWQIQVLNVGPNVCRFLVRRSEFTVARGIDIFVEWSHERLILEQTNWIL